MFEDVLYNEREERVQIARRLEQLLEKYHVTRERIAAELDIYLDILIDVLSASVEVPIQRCRDYFYRVESYLVV